MLVIGSLRATAHLAGGELLADRLVALEHIERLARRRHDADGRPHGFLGAGTQEKQRGDHPCSQSEETHRIILSLDHNRFGEAVRTPAA